MASAAETTPEAAPAAPAMATPLPPPRLLPTSPVGSGGRAPPSPPMGASGDCPSPPSTQWELQCAIAASLGAALPSPPPAARAAVGTPAAAAAAATPLSCVGGDDGGPAAFRVPRDVLRDELFPLLGRAGLRKLVATSRPMLALVATYPQHRRRCFTNFRPLFIAELQHRAEYFKRGSAGAALWRNTAAHFEEHDDLVFCDSADVAAFVFPQGMFHSDAAQQGKAAAQVRQFLFDLVLREEGYDQAYAARIPTPLLLLRPDLREPVAMYAALQRHAPRYFAQGRSCHEARKVRTVERSTHGAEYRGFVTSGEGGEHYVSFHTVANPTPAGTADTVAPLGVALPFCTCPLHTKTGYVCKHLVAVLLHAAERSPPPRWETPRQRFAFTAATLPLAAPLPLPELAHLPPARGEERGEGAGGGPGTPLRQTGSRALIDSPLVPPPFIDSPLWCPARGTAAAPDAAGAPLWCQAQHRLQQGSPFGRPYGGPTRSDGSPMFGGIYARRPVRPPSMP